MNALRAVLDTHIALEAFVWLSPRHSPLREACERARLVLLASSATWEEFCRVLGYTRLQLSDPDQNAACVLYRAQLTFVDSILVPSTLPKCSDPDDQKFLELAFSADADVLLTRDKKLRKIAKNRQYRSRFQTIDPALLNWDDLSLAASQIERRHIDNNRCAI